MRPTVRTITPRRVPAPLPRKRGRLPLTITGAIMIAFLAFHFGTGHASVTHNAIRSGLTGNCLDVLHNGEVRGTSIDLSSCNGTEAQDWVTTATSIRQEGKNLCVAANQAGVIALDACSDAPNEVWLRDQQGYFNPGTDRCLAAVQDGAQLQLASCNKLSSQGETWLPDSGAQEPACTGSKGEAVACNAVRQWTAWQASGSNHQSLLTKYTDGTPYEEWCADFVSYIYQQAGYPFTNGSADGWDENDANQIQYMGFTLHEAGDGYVPQAGDVAFFSYPGGHVELVVKGGQNPTFVYGDSAEVDPATGNGQMKANTITRDGPEGQLLYYLTPTTKS